MATVFLRLKPPCRTGPRRTSAHWKARLCRNTRRPCGIVYLLLIHDWQNKTHHSVDISPRKTSLTRNKCLGDEKQMSRTRNISQRSAGHRGASWHVFYVHITNFVQHGVMTLLTTVRYHRRESVPSACWEMLGTVRLRGGSEREKTPLHRDALQLQRLARVWDVWPTLLPEMALSVLCAPSFCCSHRVVKNHLSPLSRNQELSLTRIRHLYFIRQNKA